MCCGVVAVRDVVACGVAAGRRSSRHGRRSSADLQVRRFAGFMVPKRERDKLRVPAGSSAPVPRVTTAPRAAQLSPSDLAAAVRSASQGPRADDLRMWRDYAEQTLFHAGVLTPKQMAFITNGFARAAVPDRDVFRRLADRALEKVGDFEPRDTALLLNAYAKLAFRDLVMFQEFAKSIRSDTAAGYGEQQLSLIVNAFARLEIRDAALFQTLSSWIVAKTHELTAQGVATVANAYAKVSIQDAALMQAVIASVGRHLQSFGPHHLSNILNAYSKLQVGEQEVVERLVSQVPGCVHDFGPVDLAATVNAMSKLSVQHRQAWSALAAAVRDRGDEFRARQIAVALHSFSMLTVAYNGLLGDMSPHVLDNVDMADDQSLVMLFCAYARAGQPQGLVVRCLLDRLDSRAPALEAQALVNVFYACGRLGLQKEPFTQHLASELLQEVPALSPQHVSNCLYAVARLSIVTEEFSSLLEALQRRALRGDLDFEPQHLANMLHALAAVHAGSDGKMLQGQVPLPGTLVPSLVSRTLRCRSWREEPQLLASIAVSCARLGQGSAPLFTLVSETVQHAPASLSKAVIVDLVGAFGAAQFFDVEFYSWALDQYTSGGPGTSTLAQTLRLLHALHYANYVFATSQDLTRFPREAAHQGQADSMLFLDCPANFRQQARSFYEETALSVLSRAESLPKSLLADVAVPFAHAHLLSATAPFDLLSTAMQRHTAVLADSSPHVPLLGVAGPAADAEALPTSNEGIQTVSDEEVVGETILNHLVNELQEPVEEPVDAAFLVQRLARYAKLLGQNASSASIAQKEPGISVPASVLDPLLREMGSQLVANVPVLSFADLAGALEALGDAGLCPRSVAQALAEAAEARFPVGDGCLPNVAAVAKLCRGLGAAGINPSTGLRARLREFVESLASLESSATEGLSTVMGERPLRAVSTMLDSLEEASVLTDESLSALLIFALRPLLEELQSVQASQAAAATRGQAGVELKDVAGFFMVLSRLLSTRSAGAGHILYDTSVLTGVLLMQLLSKWQSNAHSVEVLALGQRQILRVLLELVQSLATYRSSVQSSSVNSKSHPTEAWHLELLVAISEQLTQNAQALGPPGLVLCLSAFSNMRLLVLLEAPGLSDPGGSAATAVKHAAIHRSCGACGVSFEKMPEIFSDDLQGASSANLPQVQLPRLVMSLLRAALLQVRRLSPAEAARVAHFCASALDAQSLSKAERDEVSTGLAQLLERLCWERQRWSQEDRRLVASVGTLLRSEFPELLRSSGWVSRSVQAALEEVRRASG